MPRLCVCRLARSMLWCTAGFPRVRCVRRQRQRFTRGRGARSPYQGDSLASFANKVFVELLKTPKHREQLGGALYRKLWVSQGRRCNLCGCMNAKLEVDHIAPLCTGGSNDLEHLQII